MELLLENLPPSLRDRANAIWEFLIAFDKVMPLRAVYWFGSHARGDARPDSDVDLCLVSDGAGRQLDAAAHGTRHSSRLHEIFRLSTVGEGTGYGRTKEVHHGVQRESRPAASSDQRNIDRHRVSEDGPGEGLDGTFLALVKILFFPGTQAKLFAACGHIKPFQEAFFRDFEIED
jgi:predicted nucleotidyltransferase